MLHLGLRLVLQLLDARPQVFDICEVLVALSLRNQQLFGEVDLHSLFLLLALGFLVLHVENAEHAVMPRGKEHLVVEGDA